MPLPRMFVSLVGFITVISSGVADTGLITPNTVAEAEKLIGLNFTVPKRELLLDSVKGRVSDFERNRQVDIPYGTFPAVLFNPIPQGFQIPTERRQPKWSPQPRVKRPADLHE
ncbi:MAG: hypothetical protein ACK4UN_17105, partial [Limisphaerales bacterium]